MASVMIKRNVLLRAIVTETLKKDVAEELQAGADEINGRIEELEVAGRRYYLDLQRTDLQKAMALRQQVEAEKKKQEEVRDRLLERKQQVGEWKLGEEVVRGTVESLVEVKEGDNLAVLLGGTEIVVEDDIVKAIRERSPEELEAAVSALVEPDSAAEGDIIGAIETGG